MYRVRLPILQGQFHFIIRWSGGRIAVRISKTNYPDRKRVTRLSCIFRPSHLFAYFVFVS